MRLTVGPLPPAVYWRRRAIVLAAVLLVLFLIAQACVSTAATPGDRAAGESASPAATTTPASGSSPASTAGTDRPAGQEDPGGDQAGQEGGGEQPGGEGSGETTQPPDGKNCTDQEMQIVAVADQTSFAQGTDVQFTIQIRNDSSRTCRRDIGGDRRELFLRRGTGATKVWSSRDCGAPTGRAVRDLEPGFATKHYLVWSGQASDTCDGDQPGGELLGAGEYELVARLGTAYSEPVPITIG